MALGLGVVLIVLGLVVIDDVAAAEPCTAKREVR
jgi:hypothetical protein